MSNPDSYFNRTEVSNSDLTELKNLLYPQLQFGDKEKAFKFGTLLDAMITENDRVNYFKLKVDDVQYTPEDFALAEEMKYSLRKEAQKDKFLAYVLESSDTQKFMVNKNQKFEYGNFEYTLDTRCKWDWWLPALNFGGDLKSTAAETQKQFNDALEHFDWDRSRAWYMDIAGSEQDFIYAISKKNCRVFKAFIKRGDETYNRGKDKYNELAFKWWMLIA